MSIKILHDGPGLLTAGCDEAGRGCLAGPVFAAAVVFPIGYTHPMIDDSKKLSARMRDKLTEEIKDSALAWAVASADAAEVDAMNILNASILSMHRALDLLGITPDFILVDGNRFKPYKQLSHSCEVGGDGRFLSIAAASILAKTARDTYMQKIHDLYPGYGWDKNKGYPTRFHIEAIDELGLSPYHRRSFRASRQLKIQL